jgi:starvation-inducible DNA-binding protein
LAEDAVTAVPKSSADRAPFAAALHAKRDGMHCYVSGPHSRDYYLLLDEQGAHIFDMRLAAHLREAHGVHDEHTDLATTGLLEIWIDDAERQVWYVFGPAATGR